LKIDFSLSVFFRVGGCYFGFEASVDIDGEVVEAGPAHGAFFFDSEGFSEAVLAKVVFAGGEDGVEDEEEADGTVVVGWGGGEGEIGGGELGFG